MPQPRHERDLAEVGDRLAGPLSKIGREVVGQRVALGAKLLVRPPRGHLDAADEALDRLGDRLDARERLGLGDRAATVTIDVSAVNDAPTMAVAASGACGGNDRSGTINLSVADIDSPAASLTLSASSSNQALVPDANVTLAGQAAAATARSRPRPSPGAPAPPCSPSA